MAAIRAYEDGVSEGVRRAPETGELHLLEEKPRLGEVPDAAERVDECVVRVGVGFAAELLHPVEGEQGLVGEALFSEEFNEARDGGGGHVTAALEEVPEGFDLGRAGEDAGHLAARGLGVGEVEAGFDPAEELEGFLGPEVGLVGVSVGRGAQDEGAVAELVVLEGEVALPQRGAVAEAALAAHGARGLEGVAGDGSENLRDGVVCPWRR